MKYLKIFTIYLLLGFFGFTCFSYGENDKNTEEKERNTEGIGITIYNAPSNTSQNYYYNQNRRNLAGYALIKEWRKLNIHKGLNLLNFEDVASFIDPSTVHFTSLTDPTGTYVLEQNYEFDLVNGDKILEKYINKDITLANYRGKDLTGKLMSFTNNQMVLEIPDDPNPIRIINRTGDIQLGALPEGLITKPTLIWQVNSRTEGEHLTKVTYQTNNINWNTDYTVVLKKNDTLLDLSGWVTINNQTGKTYKNAEIKLVAGDVNRVVRNNYRYGNRKEMCFDEQTDRGGAQFKEKSFFEYHMYTLQRPSTLKNNSIKQIELFEPALNVPTKKLYVYYGTLNYSYYYYSSVLNSRNLGISSNKKVDVYMQFKNDKKSGLGIPLPKGTVRVYKKDPADGSLEFIGEDAIDHTPKDEKVLLKLGNAFDIVGERKQTSFERGDNWIRESFEIKLKNHKEDDIEVIIKENLYRWSNWKIETASDEYSKQDFRTIHFNVNVPANGEKVVTYTVYYTW